MNRFRVDRGETANTTYRYFSDADDFVGIQEIESDFQDLYDQNVRVVVMHAEPEVMVLREIPPSQAKKEILELVQGRGQIFYSQVSELLRLDIRTVVELCEELEAEGLIEGVG